MCIFIYVLGKGKIADEAFDITILCGSKYICGSHLNMGCRVLCTQAYLCNYKVAASDGPL